ncbi:hypothetical protein Efla_000578 [Eimeria flavescens]
MESVSAEPFAKLRSLLGRMIGGDDSKAAEEAAASSSSPSDAAASYEGEKLQNWMSHFAAVAPDHIKRWMNPEDGSGDIPYEQLVENLQQFNIPARHVSQYTVGQLLGVEPLLPEGVPSPDRQLSSGSAADTPKYLPRPHKLGVQAAAYLGEKQDPSFTQVIPVRAVTKAFVGPVREKVGPISGQPCKLLKRPTQHSEVPPDYVEVVGSKQVSPIGCDMYIPSRQSSEVSAVAGAAAGALRSDSLCHKPPPIYLQPLVQHKAEEQTGGYQGSHSTAGSIAAAEFIASIPRRAPGKVDLTSIHTKEDKDIYDASKLPVVYTMGSYVWSKEQAERGEAARAELPAVDACFSRLCEEAFAPKPAAASPEAEEEKEEEKTAAEPFMGVSEIIERCKKARDQLAAFADSVVELREAPSVGGRGLFSTAEIKKGQLVFVELPLLTCDTEMEKMWSTFSSLTEEQKAALEKLEGFASDLSKEESLWCILTARANKRIDLAKPFKLFFARIKRNAHGVPTQGRWAVYPKAAMVNHSCEPNVTYRNLDGLLVYFAVRDIRPGDMITMTYVDQLYASAAFRSKRLQEIKCFSCACTRCKNMDEKERRMLCPTCRPVKLKIVDPEAGLPTSPASEEVEEEKQQEEVKKEEKEEEVQSDAYSTQGELDSNKGGGPVPSSEDEQLSEQAASEAESGSCAMSETGASASESVDAAGSDLGEGVFASDEDTQGCSDSDSASNHGMQDGLSDGEPRKLGTSSLDLKKKLGSAGSLTLSICTMEASGSKSTEWGPVASDEERSECSLDGVEAAVEPSPSSKPPKGYCQRDSDGTWVCYTCMGRFSDSELPIGMEAYFERLYLQLQTRFNLPTTPQWTVDVGSLIKSIEVVLGTQHWLYAACNLLLAQLYLGQWAGGMIRDSIFDRSLQHAEAFISFVESTAREALHVDAAPLIASLLRVLLFNGRWSVFEQWVERGRLEFVKDCLGAWDETSVSFSEAHKYLLACREKGELPQLSVLHRFAHTSQHSIVEAAKKIEEKKAAAEKAAEEAARAKLRKMQEEQKRLQALREKNERLKAHIARLKAEAAARQKVKDVTGSHPEGVLGKFMLAGVDDSLAYDASKAAQKAYQYAKQMQEEAIQGKQLCPGHLAGDFAYLPPEGIMPSKYLPLIMLDDPLRAIPEKSRQARMRRAQAARERTLLEERVAREDLDFEEDESVVEADMQGEAADSSSSSCFNNNSELTMVYRVPGLPGTAPGEFVNVSQLMHDETGQHEPLPLFKSFFYIDSGERKRNAKFQEGSGSLVVLGSSASPPVLSHEKLEDIEAAKHNYLHAERQQFEKDVRAGVLLAAAEAGALEDEQKLVDVVEATNKVIRDMTVKEARAERALEVARYSFKKMEAPEDEQHPASAAAAASAAVADDVQQLVGRPQMKTAAGCVGGGAEAAEKKQTRQLHAPAATLPSVFEGPHSQDSRDGPTVFLYPQEQQQTAAAAAGGGEQAENRPDEDASGTDVYMRRRICKKLDFSRIPPPPNPEAFAHLFGITHEHYKMARMQMMLSRQASPVRGSAAS